MKLHASLAATLSELGVSTMFGLCGDANIFVVDSFVRDNGGRYVAAANEAGSIHMASGYALASGKVGVATVTRGPGLGNTLGALINAARERVPMVLVAGDTSYHRYGLAQKIDQASIIAPTGAGYEQALSPGSAAADLARAFRRARAERRPIVYAFSVDFNFTDVEHLTSSWKAPEPQAVSPDPAAMDIAVGLIASARRPLILAGAGAVWPNASDALRRLAQVLGAPVATTLAAKGLFGYDKDDLGVMGTFASERAAATIMDSDCIIAVGASLNQYTGGTVGGGWPLLKGKRVVQCDIDPAAVGRLYPVDAPVVGDAISFANMVVEWLEEAEYTPSNYRETVLPDDRLSATEALETAGLPNGFVDLSAALTHINHVLPTERSIAVDGGRFAHEAIRIMQVPRAQSWNCAGRGFGAVGCGFSAALGVGCALPEAPVVAVVGDGGFMMGGLTEFNTAVRHGIDLITVVCNDGSYGAEYRKLSAQDFDITASLFDWPDFGPVATSLGGFGFTVRSSSDLSDVRDVIAERDRPILLDLKLDPATIH